jgi:hypothetical protein
MDDNQPIETVRHSTTPTQRRRGTINSAQSNPPRQADDSNVDQTELALTMLAPFAGLGGTGVAGALRAMMLAKRSEQAKLETDRMGFSATRGSRLSDHKRHQFGKQFDGASELHADPSQSFIKPAVKLDAPPLETLQSPGVYGEMRAGFDPHQMMNSYEVNNAAQSARDALRRILMERAMGR